ncbi:Cysteine protease ATG4a [Striga hermonthica]|uniref:Cysteine protease n=1 Tax=Striga hermonthica TaxID=68872 RepID=A0A9N7RCG0_STRHE|nr:Cysteine protease ATG4a [Striga hermonthica]
MKGYREFKSNPIRNSEKIKLKSKKTAGSVSPEVEPSIGYCTHQKPTALWSGIWSSSISIFGSSSFINHQKGESKNCCSSSCGIRKRSSGGRNYYEVWRATVRRVMMNGGSMRRILGFSRSSVLASKSDIWILGVCYQISKEGEDSSNPTQSEDFATFVEDFSSRILITYRKGFSPIMDTKYTSDINWGCMIRSSQMLVAQAFLVHILGRSWRKSPHKKLDPHYIEILHLFGDAENSPCSIHNLLQVGKAYGLAPGSWVGPYAMCRTWESLLRNKSKDRDSGILSSVMTLYVVSGDEDGERGGAPVLCIEHIARHCLEFGGTQVGWAPVLLMVPLVLGLEKVNPRYLPLLTATFTFPQSLGILGGRPGASTYIIGVQDENAFYLDPHEVQQVVDIKRENLDLDTSSYHCNVVRHIPLDSIDSSLAIGFYCRDKSDFDDFCERASELIDQSNGAPLFTIAEICSSPKQVSKHAAFRDNDSSETHDYDNRLVTGESVDCSQEDDDWQLL